MKITEDKIITAFLFGVGLYLIYHLTRIIA